MPKQQSTAKINAKGWSPRSGAAKRVDHVTQPHAPQRQQRPTRRATRVRETLSKQGMRTGWRGGRGKSSSSVAARARETIHGRACAVRAMCPWRHFPPAAHTTRARPHPNAGPPARVMQRSRPRGVRAVRALFWARGGGGGAKPTQPSVARHTGSPLHCLPRPRLKGFVVPLSGWRAGHDAATPSTKLTRGSRKHFEYMGNLSRLFDSHPESLSACSHATSQRRPI